jgi:hypothetical protein
MRRREKEAGEAGPGQGRGQREAGEEQEGRRRGTEQGDHGEAQQSTSEEEDGEGGEVEPERRGSERGVQDGNPGWGGDEWMCDGAFEVGAPGERRGAASLVPGPFHHTRRGRNHHREKKSTGKQNS